MAVAMAFFWATKIKRQGLGRQTLGAVKVVHMTPTTPTPPTSTLHRLQSRVMSSWLVKGTMHWLELDGMRMSASMAFYAMLSLAPLLVLMVAGLGWWLDRSTVESTVVAQIQAVTGERVASAVEQAMQSATAPEQGLIASVIAFGVLLMAATGVFVALQDSLKVIWGVPKSPEQPWWWVAVLRLRGVGYMLALGGLLMGSLVLSTVLRVLSNLLGETLNYPLLWTVLNETLAFVFVTLLFVGLMRISDGKKPSLRYLMAASTIGAVLFTIGKHAMAVYLSGAAAVSAYGAAGSLVALLMWLYFSSAILLLSASLAQSLAEAEAEAAQNRAGEVLSPAPQPPMT